MEFARYYTKHWPNQGVHVQVFPRFRFAIGFRSARSAGTRTPAGEAEPSTSEFVQHDRNQPERAMALLHSFEFVLRSRASAPRPKPIHRARWLLGIAIGGGAIHLPR
jgi:hypothetical protein